MRILDWLAGKRNRIGVGDDVIWLTQPAKFAGIARAVSLLSDSRDPPQAVILAAHFRDCLGEIQKIIDACEFGIPVTAVAVENFTSVSPGKVQLSPSQRIEIIVGERHPLSSRDATVAAFAHNLPCRCNIVFHVSLDDALMKAFAGEWVQNVLKQLGMQEWEAIQSKVVARRIQQAQRQIAKRALGDEPADSAEEWLACNLPDARS